MNDAVKDPRENLPAFRVLPDAVKNQHKGIGPPVGVFYSVDESQYHAGPGLGSTNIKTLNRSPAHYKASLHGEYKSTPAKRMGSALHAGILEPWSFSARVICGLKIERRSKKDQQSWAEFEQEHAEKIIIPHTSWDHLLRVIDAVREHPIASRLLTIGDPEVTAYWVDDRPIEGHDPTYRLCKARFDWLDTLAHNVIVDLKSTEDASYTSFLRQCYAQQYHVQAAHYLAGARRVLPQSPDAYLLIAFEKSPPYAVACYELPRDLIRIGAIAVARALTVYHECMTSKHWPSYPEEVRMLEALPWMQRSDIM